MEKSDLIVKFLNGEVSESELQQLYQWVNESDENRAVFAEFKNSRAILASKLTPDSSAADFDSLMKKIPQKKKSAFSVKKLYRIAAAILFPVILAICAWLVHEHYFQIIDPVYTEIIAPPKHNSQVVLADGTQVWLSPESKLVYNQLYGQVNRKVKLIGEGYFEVAHNTEKPFFVETYGLDVRVLGTSFNVEAYTEDKIVRTTLVRGSLQVESEEFQNEIVLTPGDRLSVNVEENKVHIEKVNTEIYRLVKDGLLIFKRNNLNEVCRKLERWFMIPIEYDGKGNQNLLFTAKFEDESIERILKIVGETIPINYQIRQDKIIITYKNGNQ